ncbi:MAG: hypothetical protein HC905_03990 [Bacteroidales bacterium]|nr:hypothetical protein [Bacteroidales bacterium]
MMENNLDIEKVTDGWLRNLEADDPPTGFNGRVMQSIYELQPAKAPYTFNYLWLLLLLPLLGAAGWYLSTFPAFVSRVTLVVSTITHYYNSANTAFGDMFTSIKNISISPMIILGF